MINKKKVLFTVVNYNQRVAKMLNEAKKLSSDAKSKWEGVEKSLAEVSTLPSDLREDNEALSQLYLSMIDHFNSANEQIQNVISLKHKVNNNQVKIKAVCDVLGEDAGLQDGESVLTFQEPPQMTPEQVKALEDAKEEEDSLKVDLTARNTQLERLEADIKNTKTRNQMLEREIKKNKDQITIFKVDNFDQQEIDLLKQIEEIKEELALFSS